MKFEKYELKNSLVLSVLNNFIEVLHWFFTSEKKFWKRKNFRM